jgi:aspartate racemase
MPAIGILGGMGPQASASLHQTIIKKIPTMLLIRSDTDFPEIVHISAPVPNFISNKKNMRLVKQMLTSRTQLLEQAGCTVAGVACNTAHLLLGDLQTSTTMNFVSLPQLVAQKIQAKAYKRVGLLATPTTLASSLYDDEMPGDATLVRPTKHIAQVLEAMIFRQIIGVSSDEDRTRLRTIVEEFGADEKLDAVILGCTELPLIYGDTLEGGVQVIDTIEVLAEGLLNRYVEKIKS